MPVKSNWVNGQLVSASDMNPVGVLLNSLEARIPGAANPLYFTSGVIEPISKMFVTGEQAVDSGDLVLVHFVAGASQSVTTILTAAAADSTQSAATLCKVGLYSWDGTTYTLLVASATSATRWNGPGVKSAAITSTPLVAGTEYAVGLIHVGSTGTPTLLTSPITNLSDMHGPRIARIVFGVADLESSIAGSDASASWFIPWSVIQ